jgi:hypothetical protein
MGSARFQVRRVGGVVSGATVDFAAFDGTAAGAAGPGQDYGPASGTLTFAAGQTVLTFSVPIVKDALREGDETVLLRLSNPAPVAEGAALGTPNVVVLKIADDDIPGRIRFSSARYSVGEGAGSAKVVVKRVGGRAGPVTVHYATTAGSALGVSDYDDTSGDLTFGPTEPGATLQTILVPVHDDALREGAESFTVTLSAPGGGAILGSPAAATVTILDDEPTLEFASPAYIVKESQTTAVVAVR